MEGLIPTLREEGEEVIGTLREEGEEAIDTVQEQTIIAGVQTINGKAGDLHLKTINGQDLLTTGDLSLATSAQLQAETEAREQADQTLQGAIDGKQAQLTNTQLAAVNSGIDSTKVGQIATNKSDIATLQANKQDKLTQTQLNAVNSGIDQTKVAQIATNTGNITSNTGRITTIEGKIPSAATSSNQLADKNYVDNSIATNTANYISDDGEPFQSLADLEAYSGPLTNNDYAFVVGTDSAGNTTYTRYKYNADLDLWAEEYTISNPTFTSTQWAAIDSGVTANDVTQIGTNKSDIANLQSGKQDALSQTQLDAINSGIDATKVQQIATNAGNITSLQTDKQDKLIAGTNIQIAADGKTISATDTTYSAGTGIDLTGTTFSVDSSVVALQSDLPTKTSDLTNDGADGNSTYVENDDLTTALAGKQNTLTAGANVQIAGDTISATDTTYTAGTGLTLAGTEFSVTEPVPAGFFSNTNATQEGIGTSYTINDTVEAPIDSVELKGDTYQFTTTGKNLFDFDAFLTTAGATYTKSGNIYSISNLGTAYSNPQPVALENGSTYTISQLLQQQATTGLRIDILKNGVQYTSCYATDSSNLVKTFTADSSTYSIRINYSSASYPFQFNSLMIEKSASPTSYEPYTAGASPNPSYPQDIQVVTGEQTIKLTGKNLCSSATVRSTTHIDFVADCAAITSNKVVLSAITNDTVSNASVYVFVDDVDLHQSAGAFSGTAGQRGYAVLTFQQTVMDAIQAGKTLKLDLYKGSGSFSSVSNAQIELGDQMTDYESYRAQSYTIDLGSIELAKIGTYQDYIWKDGDAWKIHKVIGKVVLDGSETWTNYGNAGGLYTAISAIGATADTDISPVMSDNFTAISYSDGYYGNQKYGVAINPAGVRLAFIYDGITAGSAWKTWLSNHNTTVYYALSTPTNTVITDANLIAQLNALAQAKTYAPRTNVITSAVSPNLPAIAWLKVYNDNMAGVEGAIGNVNDTLGGKASKDFALEQGSVAPSFTGLTPIKTFTWTVADTTYRPVYQMDNTGWANDNMDITVAYRITVTGTGISQIADIIDRWHYPTTSPVTSMMNRSLSGSNATTGFRVLRAVYPNSSGLNNNTYKIGQEISNYNSTSRTITVEVFKTDPKVTWNETKPAGSIYITSTYQGNNNITVSTNRGWLLRQPTVLNASSANSATRVSSYESATIASSQIRAGATALVANHLAFQATDGLIYDISDTTKNMVCDENAKIGFISNAISANGAIDMTYMRQLYNLPSTAVGYIPHAAIALGDRVYLRCTMDGSGNIHSDNYLATSMSAGYTWVSFGMATAADTIYMDARKPMFYTLDANGKLTHINGLPIAGGGA